MPSRARCRAVASGDNTGEPIGSSSSPHAAIQIGSARDQSSAAASVAEPDAAGGEEQRVDAGQPIGPALCRPHQQPEHDDELQGEMAQLRARPSPEPDKPGKRHRQHAGAHEEHLLHAGSRRPRRGCSCTGRRCDRTPATAIRAPAATARWARHRQRQRRACPEPRAAQMPAGRREHQGDAKRRRVGRHGVLGEQRHAGQRAKQQPPARIVTAFDLEERGAQGQPQHQLDAVHRVEPEQHLQQRRRDDRRAGDRLSEA